VLVGTSVGIGVAVAAGVGVGVGAAGEITHPRVNVDAINNMSIKMLVIFIVNHFVIPVFNCTQPLAALKIYVCRSPCQYP